MKILYLKLENHIGITQGLNRSVIEIDFTKFNKKKILLLGKNGSGKTTLMSTLHPFADSFDDRTSLVPVGEDGYKEIHIGSDDDIYVIQHFYGKKMKSFISKNDEELNPNGGVRTFESLVETELGVTKDFFKLIKLGSSSNFIDMNASTRKQFISKFMPSIEPYSLAYSILTKKLTAQTKEFKFLSDEITKLGDIEAISSEINSIEFALKNTSGLIIKENVELSKENEKLKYLKENSTELEKEVSEYESLKQELTTLQNSIEATIEKFPNTFKDKDQVDLKTRLESTKKKISSSNIELTELNTELSNNTTTLNNYTVELQGIEKNINMIKGDSNFNFDLSNASITKSEKLIAKYDSFFSEFDTDTKEIYDTINDKILNSLKAIMNSIIDIKSTMVSQGIGNDLKFIFREMKEPFLKDKKDTLEEEYKVIAKEVKELENNLLINSSRRKVAVLCTDPTCSVYKINEELEEVSSSIEKAREKEKKVLNSLKQIQGLRENYSELSSFFKNISTALSSLSITIKSHFFGGNHSDIEEFYNELIANITLDEIDEVFDIVNIERFIEFKSLRETSVNNINSLKIKIDANSNSTKMQKKLNIDKKALQEKLTELEEMIHKGSLKVNDIKSTLNNENKRFSLLELHLQMLDKEKELVKAINRGKKTYLSTKESLENFNVILDNVEGLESRLEELQAESAVLNTKLNALSLKKARIEEYVIRKDILDLRRKKYLVIKDTVDIKTGIPLVLLGNYIESIKHVTNRLLDIAFQDNFRIDFLISDSEFSIPVIKNNDVTRDIIECSDGQKAVTKTALSLGIIMEAILSSPKKYNIVYLDEVDATLDIENKQAFLGILDSQLDMLDNEQCFIITHNDNFNQAELGLILLKNANVDTEDEAFMFNKEIIADFR